MPRFARTRECERVHRWAGVRSWFLFASIHAKCGEFAHVDVHRSMAAVACMREIARVCACAGVLARVYARAVAMSRWHRSSDALQERRASPPSWSTGAGGRCARLGTATHLEPRPAKRFHSAQNIRCAQAARPRQRASGLHVSAACAASRRRPGHGRNRETGLRAGQYGHECSMPVAVLLRAASQAREPRDPSGAAPDPVPQRPDPGRSPTGPGRTGAPQPGRRQRRPGPCRIGEPLASHPGHRPMSA